MAHPLRGTNGADGGYEQDTPLLLGDFVTTEAGTGFVHIAPGHGEDDFDLGRANGLDVPETVGDDGTFNPWVPLFAGVHVYKAADPVCERAEGGGHAAGPRQDRALLPAFLALQGAADLPRDAAMVRPHGWARARSGRRRSRRSMRPSSFPTAGATVSAPWSRTVRTGASAVSAPGACRSPSSSRSAPASRCAIRPWSSASLRPSRRKAPTPGMLRRRPVSSDRTAIRTTMSR